MRLEAQNPQFGDATFAVEQERIVLGRGKPETGVAVDLRFDRLVSRKHAVIIREGGDIWIEDLGSKHGTYVNDARIEGRARLQQGDVIRVGDTTIRLAVPEELPPDLSLSDVLRADQHPFEAVEEEAGVDERLENAQRKLAVLHNVALALGEKTELESLLQTAVEQLVEAIEGAERAALLLRDSHSGAPVLKAHVPKGAPSVSLTLASRAMESREAFVWTREQSQAEEAESASVLLHGIRSGVYAPLARGDDVLGVVCVDTSQIGTEFTSDDLRLVMAVANQVAMFVANLSIQHRLQREAAVKANLLRQFSPRVAEKLMDLSRRASLGGERVAVTILCADVRGFSTLTRDMDPQAVVWMLNEYFEELIAAIFECDGTVDKYTGDGLLAIMGSPDPDEHQHEKAVRAAWRMQEVVRQVSQRRTARHEPTLEIGIGVHSGEVIHGFIGARERMEFTVIGDPVNRAARYCDGAGPGDTIISPAVFEHVYSKVRADHVVIPGKREGEGDYEGYKILELL